MKNKVLESTVDAIIDATSKRTSDRTKEFALKKISIASPLLIVGGYLSFCNTSNYDPLGAMTLLNNFGIDPKYALTSVFIASTLVFYKKDNFIIDIAKYGSDYCPYQSYDIAMRDLNGKRIQQKINKFYDIYSRFGNNSEFGKISKNTGKKIEEIVYSLGEGINKVADFFGKKDVGFKIYTNKNPKLINELIVPRDLKKMSNPIQMDNDNPYKINQRKFVNELIQESIKNSEQEIIERNVSLALVKAIDKIKMGDYDNTDIEILKKISQLDQVTRIGKIKPYENISKLLDLIIKDNKIEFSIQFFGVKNWKKDLNKNERIYHIFKELDKICYNNNIEIIKKPLRYEEIYRNETIMEFQNKLRLNFVHINKEIQNKAPIIYSHFIEGTKFELNNDYSITKMLGVKKKEIISSMIEEETKEIKQKEIKNNYRYNNINKRRG